jgi:hypothetical protein
MNIEIKSKYINRSVELIIPTINEAIKLEVNNKIGFIEPMINIAVGITNLSRDEVLSLGFMDIAFILTSYRVVFYHDVPVYESKDGKEKIMPIDLINKDFKRSEDEILFLIAGERFSTYMKMSECLKAEKYAKDNGKVDIFPLLILSCCHEDGFDAGNKVFENEPNNPINRGSRASLLNELMTNSLVRANLELSIDEDGKTLPISLATNEIELPNGNEVIKEFPFRSSLLFDI